MNPRPGVRRVRDSRFVPHVDDPHPGARGRGQHFVEMIAHQRENRIDSQRRGRLHEQFCARWHAAYCTVTYAPSALRNVSIWRITSASPAGKVGIFAFTWHRPDPTNPANCASATCPPMVTRTVPVTGAAP